MASTVRTKTKTEVLTDTVRQTPVDVYALRFSRRAASVVILLLVLVWVFCFVRRLLEDRPKDYSRIEDHFKYGSIGSEPGGSLFNALGGLLPPYWIFVALPSICPDKLPGGYASLG